MREAEKRQDARRLRRQMTPHEHRLWQELRDRRFAGAKFRRQFPIGPYIADFACPASRLVIEIDGGQHSDSHYDRDRDTDLKRAGWTVLRFWNHEILENREGVLTAIAQHCRI